MWKNFEVKSGTQLITFKTSFSEQFQPIHAVCGHSLKNKKGLLFFKKKGRFFLQT